ncbi:MAG: ABC transporter permease [Acidobacteria bacterium]|nr:ABC transporter permease [Acidobacteriota bacterium]
MVMRFALLSDVIVMAYDTLRANKMRSALTVLGVVIGITAIVGMTSIIRGFDESLRDSIRQLGPDTLFVAKFSGLSFASGKEFKDLIKRPVLTVADARAIERDAPSAGKVDVWLGAWGVGTRERAYYKGEKTKQLAIIGVSENYAEVNYLKIAGGRFFVGAEVEHRRNLAVLGDSPSKALFPNVDPVGKLIRIAGDEYEVIGFIAPRPSVGGLGGGQDDFIVIPFTTYQKQFGWRRMSGNIHAGGTSTNANAFKSAMIAVVPAEGATRDQAMAEVEQVMRIRHGLKLEQPDDFDLITQDAALKMWDQISGATFIGLVVISSIALMVGGIGVMAIMMISVTERTREIGVRKALGARRREILWQFLFEAVFLTSLGGILGVVMGASIGMGVHYFTGFPVSLPWWSFALGLGFSGGVGIFFGLVPAVRASRLDPIEALRYE